MWSDTLTCEEVDCSLRAAFVLQRECSWAAPLLDSRRDIIEWLTLPREQRPSCSSPSNTEVKSLLFEIRFALELHRAGATAEYEFATGVGRSSVDFRIIGKQEWLVELVSLFESQAIKEATWHQDIRDGLSLFGMHLGSYSDARHTEEDEMIKAQERIAAKVFNGRSVIKFPAPRHAYHLLLVDARGYLGQGGDCFDWFQMSLGAEATKALDAPLVKCWTYPHTRYLRRYVAFSKSAIRQEQQNLCRSGFTLSDLFAKKAMGKDRLPVHHRSFAFPSLWSFG